MINALQGIALSLACGLAAIFIIAATFATLIALAKWADR